MQLLETPQTETHLALMTIGKFATIITPTAFRGSIRIVITESLEETGVRLAPPFRDGFGAAASTIFFELIPTVKTDEELAAACQQVGAIVDVTRLTEFHFKL